MDHVPIPLTHEERFYIYERDNFTCQYCNQTVPDVILDIDVSFCKVIECKYYLENAITTCSECNIVDVHGHCKQLVFEKSYQESYDEFAARTAITTADFLELYVRDYIGPCEFSQVFRTETLKEILYTLSIQDVICIAMDVIKTLQVPSNFVKHFCIICRQKIRLHRESTKRDGFPLPDMFIYKSPKSIKHGK